MRSMSVLAPTEPTVTESIPILSLSSPLNSFPCKVNYECDDDRSILLGTFFFSSVECVCVPFERRAYSPNEHRLLQSTIWI